MSRKFAAYLLSILYCLVLMTQVADAWVDNSWDQQTQQMLAGAGNQAAEGKEISSEVDVHQVVLDFLDWTLWFARAENDEEISVALADLHAVVPIYLKLEVLRL